MAEDETAQARNTQRSAALVLKVLYILLGSSVALTRPGYAHNSWGHVSGGAGVADGLFSNTEGFFHFGGGYEGLFLGGVGAGAEIGYVGFFQNADDGFGLFSPGILYAFSRDEKTVPFLTLGYSLAFRDGTGHGAFFGGGLNYWIGERWGIRVENRNNVIQGGLGLIEFRFAVVLRGN